MSVEQPVRAEGSALAQSEAAVREVAKHSKLKEQGEERRK
jgi:hypothetical protein